MSNADDLNPVTMATLDRLLTARHAVSAMSLSRELGCNEADVRSSLSSLSQRGCELRDEPGSGVTLVRTSLEVWEQGLRAAIKYGPARRIEVYRSTASTQDLVRQRIEALGEAARGCVIVADEQTAGRGRLGRRWVAPSGALVVFSVGVLEESLVSVDRLTFASAVAIARGVERAAGLSAGTVKIKWPNDLMIDGKKLAGILVETFPWRQRTAAVLGVGVNVSLEAEQLRDADPELARRVTSLAMIGRRVDRLAVLREVMIELDTALAATDLTPLLNQWRQRCEQMSRAVTLSCSGRVYRGTVENLDPHEGLIVRTQEGALVHLPAATTTVLG